MKKITIVHVECLFIVILQYNDFYGHYQIRVIHRAAKRVGKCLSRLGAPSAHRDTRAFAVRKRVHYQRLGDRIGTCTGDG